MDMFLIRHAIAVERSPAFPDEERPLTERGIERFAKGVRGMGRLKIEFDQVFHSPWARSVQSAELLAPLTLGSREVTDRLADMPDEELIAMVARTNASRVALVGHQPWMSELCSLLLMGSTEVAERIPVKKGGMVWLRGEARSGGMKLQAFLSPKLLRRLGQKRGKRQPPRQP